jgi:hypothetical protein
MIALTYFPSLTQPQGKRVRTTWEKLCERLSVPRVSADKHDVPGFSLATYAGDRRALANVESVYAIGLDLDEGVSLSDLRGKFTSSRAFVHTTWSSTLDAPRCRVFLLLSRPVTADEYRRVYHGTAIIAERGGLVVDRQASDPSRFWFLPSVPTETSAMVHWKCDGAPIDVEGALRAVPPPAPYVPPTRPLGASATPAFERARKYAATIPGAIEGSGGSAHTFVVACKLVRGFALSVEDALHIMAEWNERCSPPWSERDLRRKVEEAAKNGRMSEGDMLGARGR